VDSLTGEGVSGQPGGNRPSRNPGEWQRRPLLSRGLRVLIFGGPVALSFAAALLLSHALPRATGPWTAALWVGIVAIASLLTLVVFERAARRLLPLAALLNVSLLFPDKAPARFAVARRTGSPRELRERLAAARSSGKLDQAQQLSTVIELVLALSIHDRASRGHSERVRVFTDLLTGELRLPERDRARLRWAALLHDVGKLEVPATLLNKPARPTEAEWAVLHRHPEEGARLVAPLLPWLGEWGDAVEQHHERFDGTGYPHRLKGHDISLAARIVSVADVYEVMTAPRPYKRPMSVAAARQELIRVAGTQLDPAIVRAFLNISVGRLWKTIGLGAWIAQVPTLGRFLSGLGTWAGTGAATLGAIGAIGVAGPSAVPAIGHGNSGLISLSPPGVVLSGEGSTPTPVTTSGSPTQRATPRAAPTVSPRQSAAPSSQSTTSTSPPSASGPSQGPTSRPSPQPTPTPSPAPTATPSLGPTATPSPTPGPFNCNACTTTSTSCTSYCTNNNLVLCVTYCQGNNNVSCTSDCFGSNNPACISWCAGTNNPSCISNCNATVTLALWVPAPGGSALEEIPGSTRVRGAAEGLLAAGAVFLLVGAGAFTASARGRRIQL
jgi:HD domain